MGLENLKIDDENLLSDILDEISELETNIETGAISGYTAKEIIKSLDEIKLSKYIEKSFKNDDNEWLTYSDMKNNKFYPFMVQACIDLLGNKLGNKKYDENGNEILEEGEGGKTLDEYMTSIGGIDNIYGNGTKQAVELIQKILGIHVDGLAGPQFFAKVCSVLNDEDDVSDFKVKGYNDKTHKYAYGFEKLGQDVSNIQDKFINENLEEHKQPINRNFYGIPEDTIVYTRKDIKGYYYKNENSEIIFIPSLESSDLYGPILQKYSGIDNTGKERWEYVYPSNCDYFKNRLNEKLNKAMNELGLPENTGNIEFQNGKYTLKSYGIDQEIQLYTLTTGWMYKNDLINELKLLNLCNYLKSRNYHGTFSFSKDGKRLMLNGNNLNDVFKFGETYKAIKNPRKFIEYLNKRVA